VQRVIKFGFKGSIDCPLYFVQAHEFNPGTLVPCSLFGCVAGVQTTLGAIGLLHMHIVMWRPHNNDCQMIATWDAIWHLEVLRSMAGWDSLMLKLCWTFSLHLLTSDLLDN
jgi:hypothetical protein